MEPEDEPEGKPVLVSLLVKFFSKRFDVSVLFAQLQLIETASKR